MSLINDALKKAQRDRAHPAAPQSPAAGGPATAAPAAPRAPRRSPWPFALVVLALLGGGTAVWFLKPGTTATATTVPAAVTAARVEAPPPAQEPEVPAQAPATEPQLQIHLPSATQPPAAAVATPAQPAAPLPAPVASAPAVAPAPAATAPAPAPSGPEPLKITLQMEDPRILAFLDSARINGVRSTADDAKLLMNNKVFRVGGVVDRELGLKLVQIRPGELVFEDTHGIQYRKTL